MMNYCLCCAVAFANSLPTEPPRRRRAAPTAALSRAVASPQRSLNDDENRCSVLTVGHSTRPIGAFIELLVAHGVTQLVDVRTVPRSRHNPQFNKDALPAPLAAANLASVIELARNDRVALMCAEAVPWRGHRSLIADALLVHGIATCEIVSPNRLQPHKLTSFARVQGERITYPFAEP